MARGEVAYGSVPRECDLCKAPITQLIVDGRTQMGAWSWMCIPCHRRKGVGLGTGKGQMYSLSAFNTWVKING
jgi:hypothetical protein